MKWIEENFVNKREVAERFMERPRTIDGEPIRVGDKLRACGCTIEVAALTSSRVYYFDDFGECGWKDSAKNCRHVKPDPLKELLVELTNEVWEASCTCQTTWSDSGLDGVEERYADRIRELLEVGE